MTRTKQGKREMPEKSLLVRTACRVDVSLFTFNISICNYSLSVVIQYWYFIFSLSLSNMAEWIERLLLAR